MFNRENEMKMRDLELALQSIPDEIPSKPEEKENAFTPIKNYFTGKIWYTYEYNEKTNNIDYFIPRTLVGDLKSIKNYFLNLFKKI